MFFVDAGPDPHDFWEDRNTADLPDIQTKVDPSVFTRHTDPFKAARVEQILKEVNIGNDLTNEERVTVVELITEFADCFALSVGEVKPVKGATHHLNLPANTKLKWKVHQQPLFGEKQEYFFSHVDAMLEAGIIAPIAAEDVKF
ncbi:hypothetical protein PLICRDRAFT_680690, partial [Plicaturopsis crispa FD-325 SS-3]